MFVVLTDDRKGIGEHGDRLMKGDSVVTGDVGLSLVVVPLEVDSFVLDAHRGSIYGVCTSRKTLLRETAPN